MSVVSRFVPHFRQFVVWHRSIRVSSNWVKLHLLSLTKMGKPNFLNSDLKLTPIPRLLVSPLVTPRSTCPGMLDRLVRPLWKAKNLEQNILNLENLKANTAMTSMRFNLNIPKLTQISLNWIKVNVKKKKKRTRLANMFFTVWVFFVFALTKLEKFHHLCDIIRTRRRNGERVEKPLNSINDFLRSIRVNNLWSLLCTSEIHVVKLISECNKWDVGVTSGSGEFSVKNVRVVLYKWDLTVAIWRFAALTNVYLDLPRWQYVYDFFFCFLFLHPWRPWPWFIKFIIHPDNLPANFCAQQHLLWRDTHKKSGSNISPPCKITMALALYRLISRIFGGGKRGQRLKGSCLCTDAYSRERSLMRLIPWNRQ
jgi:hypothetical protein